MPVSLDDFKEEKECVYKDERYSVRDNGAVFRHSREGKRLRKDDNQWTFGKPNDKLGYMEIATARVHLIVATAFHGAKSTKVYVVDHIDTNRRNNRPENLRWLTRLENALKNPVTRKKIEFVCGCSIEEFLANPEKYHDKFQEPDFSWMRTVTAEEAKASLQRMQDWAKSDKHPSGGSLGEWIFTQNHTPKMIEDRPELILSITPHAMQKDWETSSEFPCCPQEKTDKPIHSYAENLKIGGIFCRNKYSAFSVFNYATSNDGNTLWILCQTKDDAAIKPWALAKITYEKDVFVHSSLGAFFEQKGAEKQFCLAQGLEWLGGDTFDDYC